MWLYGLACQVPQSRRLSRQDYGNGLLCFSPGDFPDPGIKPAFPILHTDSLPTELPGEPYTLWIVSFSPKLYTFNFVLGYSQLTMWWYFQVDNEGTPPYIYMYPFSPMWILSFLIYIYIYFNWHIVDSYFLRCTVRLYKYTYIIFEIIFQHRLLQDMTMVPYSIQ